MAADDTATWSTDDATLTHRGRIVTPAAMAALIGGPLGASDWLTVTQPMVDAFADATGDYQYIHVDPVRAAASVFGTTVAHGFLTLSLIPRLMAASDCPRVAGIVMGVNYGCDRLRFIAPVPVGARIRAEFALADFVEKAKGRYQQTLDVTVVVEGADKPALIARWISQFLTANADAAMSAPGAAPPAT